MCPWAHIYSCFELYNYASIHIMSRYKTDINGYKQKVKESIESCRQATLNPDPSDPHSVKYVGISNVPHIFLYFKEEKHCFSEWENGQ